MQEILAKVMEYLPIVLQGIGALVIAATCVVKLTPSSKDDAVVADIGSKFLKFLSYLPTIGINPRTKKIEEAYLEAVKKV